MTIAQLTLLLYNRQMGLFALDDEACKQNYFLLQFNITGFIRYKLYTYILCLIKPVTSNKLH